MNYGNFILDYLCSAKGFDEVIMTPGKPTICRNQQRLYAIDENVLEAKDIAETLKGFLSQGSLSLSLAHDGHFSFGIPERGRFTVQYLTQRGSYALKIFKIPFDVPPLEELLIDKGGIIQNLMDLFELYVEGIILFTGPSHIRNSALVYAMLKKLCASARGEKVIYMLERNLSFLLKHNRALVMQCEQGSDISSMSEGIYQMLHFGPDIMYTGNVETEDELVGIIECASSNILNLMSAAATNQEILMVKYRKKLKGYFEIFEFLVKSVVVIHPHESGKLSVTILD